MSALIYDYRIKPWEIYGGRRAFFVRYADLVANVVEELKLQPIQEQFRSPAVRAMEKRATTAGEAAAYFDPDMFGGKRFAHLHYRGEVYMLNREQWQAFTNKIKNDLVKRLQSSSAISVEQIQDLSDAVDPIA